MQSARSIQNIWTERGAENNGDWFLPGDGGGTLLNGRGRAAGQGAVYHLFVFSRVYSFTPVCSNKKYGLDRKRLQVF